ncbi:MAG: hypothetical protein AAB628_02360 [Patescibacteria group bacterium]
MTRLKQHFARAREEYKTWSRWGVASVFLALLFFIALGGVSQHERWKIQHIEIKNGGVVSQDEILADVKSLLVGNYYLAYSRENSYLFPKNEIEALLVDTYPVLATVRAGRTDSHTIFIETTAREEYALWCGEKYLFENPYQKGDLTNCYFIDKDGFLFSKAPAFSSGVYFEVYAPLDYKNEGDPLRSSVRSSEYHAVTNIYDVFRKDLAEPMRIVIKEEGEISVILNTSALHPFLRGVEIRTDMNTNATTSASNLIKALSTQFPNGEVSKKKLIYIDMRFGNKIFFGYEN